MVAALQQSLQGTWLVAAVDYWQSGSVHHWAWHNWVPTW
jgi:hypothetical protein